jgi:Mg-chelatase subunit ChlD
LGIFPENPCEFALNFIRRMRSHPNIVQIPSSRQVLSIPRLILSRYYRKGNITPNDYIEISAVTSFPDNQELAKQIAFEILFPSYNKDILSPFFNGESEGLEDQDKPLDEPILSELDQIQEVIDEIELSKSIDNESIEKLEKFIEELNQKRQEEPFKSALQFFNEDAELYKDDISSLQKLIEEARKRLEQKINSLDPKDIKAAVNLNMDDMIKDKSIRDWERITADALRNRDVTADLEQLLESNKFDDLLQTIKFMQQASQENNVQKQIQYIKEQLSKQIDNLDQLFNAAKTLGETPNFDLAKVLKKSMENSSFEHNYNLANALDQYFGTDLRSEFLQGYAKQHNDRKMNLSLEMLTKNAFANKSWNELFNRALSDAIKEASEKNVKFEAFKSLANQVQQLKNSCANVLCSQKISEKLPELMAKTLKSCENPDQLRDVTEFLRKVGLNPDINEIKQMGKVLKMSEEEIYELVEPNYQLLKKIIEKNVGDFQRISNMLNQLKDQLNRERMKELMASAFQSENRDALGALGNFDLGEAIKISRQIGGDEAQNKVISCLSAGSGENLLKQWYAHRDYLPNDAKIKVKELAKKMLIDLGIYYSRARLGSATTGPIPINIVRPYTIGDDFENIDLEETIYNLLEKGKKLDHIEYDDFYVFETAKGLRSACFELDISGSMSGEKLTYMAICITMLVYGMRKDEIAVAFFESDTHVIKNLDQKIDLEKLADELLSISARGGTRIQSALNWAKRQFKDNANSREKLNILFTDAELFDLQQAIEELKTIRSLGVDFILVCPERSFNMDDANKLVKIAGGQLLTIKDWNEFPKLISDIIKSRF